MRTSSGRVYANDDMAELMLTCAEMARAIFVTHLGWSLWLAWRVREIRNSDRLCARAEESGTGRAGLMMMTGPLRVQLMYAGRELTCLRSVLQECVRMYSTVICRSRTCCLTTPERSLYHALLCLSQMPTGKTVSVRFLARE